MTVQVSIHGRLGKDLGQMQTSTGTVMTATPVAVSIPASKADVEPTTLWFSSIAFDKRAKLLLCHQQGERVNVAGTVQAYRWADKNGETHEQLQIIGGALISAHTTRPSGGKNVTQGQPSSAQKSKGQQATADVDDALNS